MLNTCRFLVKVKILMRAFFFRWKCITGKCDADANSKWACAKRVSSILTFQWTFAPNDVALKQNNSNVTGLSIHYGEKFKMRADLFEHQPETNEQNESLNEEENRQSWCRTYTRIEWKDRDSNSVHRNARKIVFLPVIFGKVCL